MFHQFHRFFVCLFFNSWIRFAQLKSATSRWIWVKYADVTWPQAEGLQRFSVMESPARSVVYISSQDVCIFSYWECLWFTKLIFEALCVYIYIRTYHLYVCSVVLHMARICVYDISSIFTYYSWCIDVDIVCQFTHILSCYIQWCLAWVSDFGIFVGIGDVKVLQGFTKEKCAFEWAGGEYR